MQYLFQPMQKHRVTLRVGAVIKCESLLLTLQNPVFEEFWPVESWDSVYI